jgi:hypothetical protein
MKDQVKAEAFNLKSKKNDDQSLEGGRLTRSE